MPWGFRPSQARSFSCSGEGDKGDLMASVTILLTMPRRFAARPSSCMGPTMRGQPWQKAAVYSTRCPAGRNSWNSIKALMRHTSPPSPINGERPLQKLSGHPIRVSMSRRSVILARPGKRPPRASQARVRFETPAGREDFEYALFCTATETGPPDQS